MQVPVARTAGVQGPPQQRQIFLDSCDAILQYHKGMKLIETDSSSTLFMSCLNLGFSDSLDDCHGGMILTQLTLTEPTFTMWKKERFGGAQPWPQRSEQVGVFGRCYDVGPWGGRLREANQPAARHGNFLSCEIMLTLVNSSVVRRTSPRNNKAQKFDKLFISEFADTRFGSGCLVFILCVTWFPFCDFHHFRPLASSRNDTIQYNSNPWLN